MKLKLPSVTLVIVETREHTLARMAIEDCLAVAEFGDVLVLTDKQGEFEANSTLPPSEQSRIRFRRVPDWPEKVGWSRSWWYDVPPLLRTAHTLNAQWDSWIWDASMWRDEFLKYDYIGAPWWYKDGLNVGNGGFSLVSTRLKRYLRDRRWQFPCDTPVDDDLLCRKYRPALQSKGFVWAPERVAHDFAFECSRPSPTSRHFGFHAMFNWSEVLSPERFKERVLVAARSKYITNPNGVIWKAFAGKHQALAAELIRKTGTSDAGRDDYATG